MRFIWLPCLLLASCSLVKPTPSEPARDTHQARAAQKAIKAGPGTLDLVFAKPGGVELLLDLHLPDGVENPPLVMAIHGGGWQRGDRKSYPLLWLTHYGYAVAAIEYRLSHEAVFPAQIHDCKGALRWLRAHQDDFAYDADKVVAIGMSAGGHLACLMGTTGGVASLEGTTAGHAQQSSEVQGVINYFGPSDFVLRAESQPEITDSPKGIVYRLLGGSVSTKLESARLASPVTHCDPGDPPLLIIHGDSDPQVLPSQSERLLEVCRANRMQAHLHVEAGKKHGWSPATSTEKKLVLDFLKKHLR